MNEKMNEKEKWIIEALKSIDFHIEGSNDWETILSIQMNALIRYIETENDEQYEIATDWYKACKENEKNSAY